MDPPPLAAHLVLGVSGLRGGRVDDRLLLLLSISPPNSSPNHRGCLRFVLQGEDFHRMLTIARLTALSLGDASVTADHWNHMKDLEVRVAGRMQQHAGRATSSAGVAPAAATGSATSEATPVSPGNSTGPLNAIPENE